MSAVFPLPYYTKQDYQQWEGRWELIHGLPFAMSPLPVLRHQKINLNIAALFKQALKNAPTCSSCQVFMPIDWHISDDTIVQPDVSVVCSPIDDNDAYITVAPKVIFEILSPATASKDRNAKYMLYEAAQVAYYVIVDPKSDVAEVYKLQQGTYTLARIVKADAYTFLLAENCEAVLDFAQIWD